MENINDIFISYSLKDIEFCDLLFNDLDKLFEVWIDREGIEGGTNWELEIEKTIKEVKVVIVIVSENSLESKWVRREIQFAQSMNKVIIPILLNSHLPISLIEKQFIDFRGDYNDAYSELLTTVVGHAEPSDKRRDELNRLIGEGIQCYLWRDMQRANNCISQAISLNHGLGSKPSSFWNTLAEAFSSSNNDETFADTFRELISFQQNSKFHSTYKNGVPMYEWSIWLGSNVEVIEKVSGIIYHLHESFPNPQQIIRNRNNQFKLTRKGWGVFTIKAEIRFIDNSEINFYHKLEFKTK